MNPGIRVELPLLCPVELTSVPDKVTDHACVANALQTPKLLSADLDVTGVGAELPLLRPVELTSVPDKVTDHASVLIALDNAVHACTLLANQSDVVKDSYCLRTSLVVHLFTQVWGLTGV